MADVETGGIFLSYRRDDTEHAAGRLGDRLAVRFGRQRLFIDVESIPPGRDFADAIEQAIARCDVVVALIGVKWTSATDDQGVRRLDDPEDFVALELRTALGRGIPVIPVLVDGAAMPKSTELPHDLEPLARRNAIHLDAESFGRDAAFLIDSLVAMLNVNDEEAGSDASRALGTAGSG